MRCRYGKVEASAQTENQDFASATISCAEPFCGPLCYNSFDQHFWKLPPGVDEKNGMGGTVSGADSERARRLQI